MQHAADDLLLVCSRNHTVERIILGKPVKKYFPKQEDFLFFNATRGRRHASKTFPKALLSLSFPVFQGSFSRFTAHVTPFTCSSSFCITDSASKFLIIRRSRMPPILATGSRGRKTWKEYFYDALQVAHFLIAMGFLWAGIVEFIRNPPYFDAYGDATSLNDLPEGLFEVRVTEDLFIEQ